MKKIIGSLLVLTLLCSSVFASGTLRGTVINALASDIVLNYAGNTKDATADGIADASQIVAAIHGLLETQADAPVALTGLVDGTYDFAFSYMNRSNGDVDVDITRVFTPDARGHWTVTGDAGIKAIAEDAVVQWTIAVVGASLESLEAATLSVTAKIQGADLNVVSYNAFVGAVGDMQGGAYGGTDAINHVYRLEALGADVTILSRTAAITDPLSGSNPIPGAKIKYTVVIQNNNSARIVGAQIADKVPNSCHFYDVDVPTVVGTENDATVALPTLTAATGTAGADIVFSNMDIPANGTVTLDYTVTID